MHSCYQSVFEIASPLPVKLQVMFSLVTKITATSTLLNAHIISILGVASLQATPLPCKLSLCLHMCCNYIHT